MAWAWCTPAHQVLHAFEEVHYFLTKLWVLEFTGQSLFKALKGRSLRTMNREAFWAPLAQNNGVVKKRFLHTIVGVLPTNVEIPLILGPPRAQGPDINDLHWSNHIPSGIWPCSTSSEKASSDKYSSSGLLLLDLPARILSTCAPLISINW